MAKPLAQWSGLDKWINHLKQFTSKETVQNILTDLGKHGVADSQNKIAKNQVKPPTTAETFAARRISGRGKLVKKKGQTRRTRSVPRKLGPVQQGITLMDTGKGIKRIQYKVSRSVLAIGVNGYMSYHQTGTKRMPARPFLVLPSEKLAVDTVYNHWRRIK